MRYVRKISIAATLILTAVALAGTAAASPPGSLYFQGYLTDPAGTPVDGNWPISFGFYFQPSGGEPFWEDTLDVTVETGVFSVVLGASGDNPVEAEFFAEGKVFVGITIWGPDGPEDLLPRQKVISNPYAFYARTAQTCDEAATFGGLEPGEVVTFSQLPDFAMTPEAMEAWLSQNGYLPGEHYSDQDAAAYLAGNDYHPGPHLTANDVAAFLAANDFEPGPYFSGSYLDLADVPGEIVFQEDLVALLGLYYDIETTDALLASKADAVHDHDGQYVASGDADSVTGDMLQSGAVSLAHLAPGACGDGEVIKYLEPDGGWSCAEDQDSATLYTGGDGISIDGQAITLDSGGCLAGYVLKRDPANDGWSCLPDKDTTYEGGTGILVANNEIALAVVPCLPGQVIKRNAAGTGWLCAEDVDTDTDTDTDTQYSGVDFAVSGQGCDPGQVLTGIDADGLPLCDADKDTVYDGSNFALSGNGCDPGQVVAGVAEDGMPVCVDDKDTQYDGSNFAASAQNCPAGQKAEGIAADGKLICSVDDAGGLGAICSDTYTSYHGRIALVRYNPATRKIYFRITTGGHVHQTDNINSWSAWTELGTAPSDAVIKSIDCSLAHYVADSNYHFGLHLDDTTGKSWYRYSYGSNIPPSGGEWFGWQDMGNPW